MKRFLLLVFMFLSLFFIAACDETKPEPDPNGNGDIVDVVEEFTVTFDSLGGSPVSSVTVQKNKKVSEPTAPTKKGFTFKFWYLEEGVEFNFDTPITSNITLKASWVAVEVENPEDPEDPVVEDPVELPEYMVILGDPTNIIKVKEGTILEKPSELLLNGKTVIGWFSDSGFTTPYLFDTPIMCDTFIYAQLGHTYQELLNLGQALGDGELTTEEYYISGKIKSINNTTYGNLTITNGTDDFPIYGIKQGDVLYGNLEYMPIVDDQITVKGKLKNFKGTIEFNETQLVEVVKQVLPEVDLSTILDSRSLPEGELTKVQGVVAQLTYADGGGRNGLYLVDETGSIYVYDNALASMVEIGHTITIIGTKTNYIIDTEQNLAAEHGYQGSIQIANPKLIIQNKEIVEYPQTAITESTIKEIMNTPVTNNITNQIFKVNGYINKVVGTGFINYYLDDLDNTTGSYVYTQWSGKDFAWLDQYDGQLVTMDITQISSKASKDGLTPRFIPIKIFDAYVLPENLFAYYAVEYGADGQFLASYTENLTNEFPLIKTVSSTAHGITDLEISYVSSNQSILIDTTGATPFFKVLNAGTATITISATHAEVTYTKEIEVVVTEKQTFNTISIAEAIAATDGTEVLVTGIVAASLVNKTGFYLIDDSGLIAIEMLSTEIEKVELGNLVVIKGIKTHVNTGESTAAGQIAVTEAQVLDNDLGTHPYNDTHFATDKTLADVMALNKAEDHTTEGFKITVSLKNVKKPYYENWYLVSGTDELRIYCSSGRQLSFLDPYADQTVVVEIALVNWNGKDLLASVIAVVLEDGTKVVNNYNFR